MWVVWRACLLALTCAVAHAQFTPDQLLSPRPVRVRDRDIGKPDEPSCDQLKAMWRFSKRQARAPEIMNDVSNYRDPLLSNVWSTLHTAPRAAPRFRYQYPIIPRQIYGRIVTKAPPNVPRTPDYDDVYASLDTPRVPTGKILRFAGSGAARYRGSANYMVPSHKNKFQILKNMVMEQQRRDRQRYLQFTSKHGLRNIAAGEDVPTDDPEYGYSTEPGYQYEEPAKPNNRKPNLANHQVSQYTRHSDVTVPRSRRSFYYPYYGYTAPEYYPDVY